MGEIKRFREKLSRRADSEHEQALIRVVLVAVASIYLMSYIHKDGQITPNEHLSVYYACSYLLFSLVLFLYVIFLAEGSSPFRRYIGMAGDIGSTAIIMYLTGENASPFFIILLWVTFGNGFRYGRKYLFASALLSVVLYGLVIRQNGFWNTHPALATGLLIGLVVLPLYVSTLLKKLKEAIQKAEEANRAKTQFLANMSHEMRTPLNGIMGMAALIQDTPLSADQEDCAKTIEASARTMLSLIDDVLDISKIEAGKYQIEAIDFDLYSLVRSTTAIVMPVAQAKGISLSTRFSSKIPFLLRGDPLQLRKIFLNLLGNAVKFTEEGEVILSAELTGETAECVSIRFSVSDTGIGIAPEAQARIFERFTQADGTVSRRFGGTGLGTTIVKQLVDLMGGHIGVQSEPGEGSTFWFTLTFDKQRGIVSHPGGECSLKESRILVVSADRETTETVQGYLASWGIRAVTASRAAQAFALLVSAADREEPYHLALVVQRSLDMDPFEFARGIKADHTIQKVQLILSADGDTEPDLETVTRRGYAAAVSIPIDKTLLFNALHFVRPDQPEQNGIANLAQRYRRRKEDRRTLSILVAEDNPTNQKVIAKILERAGHEVRLVENGELALDALEKQDFDLAILDLHMPVMGGIETAKIHRVTHTQGPRIPIVALTADATAESRRACEEAGIDAYLTKPVEVRKVLELVNAIVPYEKRPGARFPADSDRQDDTREEIPTGSDTVLNMDVLQELQTLGGRGGFLEKLVQVFLESGEQKLQEMTRAVATRNHETFRSLAHAMKGSAGQIGAMALMEECSRSSHLDPTTFRDDGTALLQRIEQEYSKAKDALLRYVRKRGSAAS